MASGVSLNSETLEKELTCPVSLRLLREAVSLVPCSHKVNEEIARELFNEIISRQVDASLSICCPICRERATRYIQDDTTRNIVKKIFDPEPQRSLTLPRSSFQLEKKPKKNLPFPGVPARFSLVKSKWETTIDYRKFRSLLHRELSLVSDTETSIFKEINLCGYKDGSQVLTVYARVQSKELENYMRTHDFIDSNFTSSFAAKDAVSIKRLFKLISEHNEIPEPYYTQIHEIIETKD
jgi:hypothetical protein